MVLYVEQKDENKWKIGMFFCSTALTSTGWVRMTLKPRHCPPSKQCGCHLISANFPKLIPREKKSLELRIEPGAAGWEASMLSTVLCGPPPLTQFAWTTFKNQLVLLNFRASKFLLGWVDSIWMSLSLSQSVKRLLDKVGDFASITQTSLNNP